MATHEHAALAVEPHDDHDLDVLDPEEPRTPLWLPLLGAGMFLGGLIYVLATQPVGKTTDELTEEATAAAQAAQAAAKAEEEARQAAQAPTPPPTPAPQPGAAPRQGG